MDPRWLERALEHAVALATPGETAFTLLQVVVPVSVAPQPYTSTGVAINGENMDQRVRDVKTYLERLRGELAENGLRRCNQSRCPLVYRRHRPRVRGRARRGPDRARDSRAGRSGTAAPRECSGQDPAWRADAIADLSSGAGGGQRKYADDRELGGPAGREFEDFDGQVTQRR